MKPRTITMLATVAGLGLALPAAAHDTGIDEKMRHLGLDAGNAYACAPDDQKSRFRRQSRHLFDHILNDHGASAAYSYAASVGFGAARDASTIDCDKMTAYWADVQKMIGVGEN